MGTDTFDGAYRDSERGQTVCKRTLHDARIDLVSMLFLF